MAYRGMNAYLFDDFTVVLNKSDIRNAKDEQFREVTLYIPKESIIQWYKELEMISEIDDEEDEW